MRFLAFTTASLMIVLAGCGSAPAPSTETKAKPAETAPAAATAPAETTPAAATAPAETAPAATATPAPPAPVAAPALTNDEQKTIYAVGLAMSRQLGQLGLSAPELELVKRALSDAAAGKPAVDIDVYGPKIDALMQSRVGGLAVKEKAAGVAYAAKAAAVSGASKSASGLVYRELKAGTGASPKATDKVKVHYRGTLLNGTEFDSSYKRNAPAEFPLNGVIPCWTEGVQKMKVGGKSALVCPADIAYGDQGRPGIPGGATLLFDVELLSIN
jgi:FKBP-type peptidyl-prolyl cis-trans isomerase FkpA